MAAAAATRTPCFSNGECAVIMNSSAYYTSFRETAKFEVGVAMLPYYPGRPGAPQNSIIGGATLWVLNGKPAKEYEGVAKFLTYASNPEVQAYWHQKHRLRADNLGGFRTDEEVRLLREKPRRAGRHRAAQHEPADGMVEGPASRQFRADPRHHQRSARGHLGRQEDGQGRPRRSGQGRQTTSSASSNAPTSRTGKGTSLRRHRSPAKALRRKPRWKNV